MKLSKGKIVKIDELVGKTLTSFTVDEKELPEYMGDKETLLVLSDGVKSYAFHHEYSPHCDSTVVLEEVHTLLKEGKER